jgi:hypothetical protein
VITLFATSDWQLDASEPEYLPPKLTREHQIPIRDNGTGDSVQANDGVEESLHENGGGVRVTQMYEVVIFGEPVGDSQDDWFVVDAGETFHEVHDHVGPHNVGHLE